MNCLRNVSLKFKTRIKNQTKRRMLIITISFLLLLAAAIFVAARGYIWTSSLEQEEQWMVSPHNFDPVESAHGAAARSSCAKCHNSEWFVRIQVKGEDPPVEDLEDPGEFGMVCSTCHETENPTNILALRKVGDVTLPAYGDVVSAGVSASCMSCHNARRENPPEYIKGSRRGAHHGPQADMLSGTGAINYGETFGSSPHTTDKGCVTCHMAATPAMGERGHNQVGVHTFKMHWDGGTPNNHNDDVENVASCQQQECHPGLDTFDRPASGDYDGDGVIEGVQTEVKGLLALLAAELPQDEEGNVSFPSDLELTTEEQRMANYNYVLVGEDGSYGIHNPAYAVQVLRTTYEKLTGNELAGETLEAPVKIPAERPVTSEAIEKRLEQWKVAGHNFDPVEAAHGAGARSHCAKCHNSEWFVRIQVKGEDPPEEDLPEPAEYGHTCSTCHDIDDELNILRLRLIGDITLPAYNDVVDGGISATCMSCHNARRVNPPEYVLTSSRGSHGGPQADMLAGKSAINYGKTLDNSSHITAVGKKCAGCHMADTPAEGEAGHNLVGGHTFSMKSDNGTPDDPTDDIENVSACQSCHGGITTFDFPAKEDFDGDGIVEGVQTEINGMLAILASVLPKDEEGNISLSEATPEERMANYNYTLVNNDGSHGVHNFRYAVDLLRTTYEELTGKSWPKDYSNVFFTELEKGLNMISLPLEPRMQYTARRMLDEFDATIIIKLDADEQRFAGFTETAPGDGFPIEGDKGYIVNALKDITVVFTGAAWTQQPSLSAPPTNARDSAWAFIASGALYDEAQFETSGKDEYTVIVKNLNTGHVARDTVEDGRFSVVWADLSRNSVIAVGNILEFVVVDAEGKQVSGEIQRKIKTLDIGKAFVNVNLRLGDSIPASSALLQNFPNPFNPETWMPYQLTKGTSVTISIYNTKGQLIRTIDLGHQAAGTYLTKDRAAYWDGQDSLGNKVASGMYFYTLQAGDFKATRRMLIVK